MTYFILNGRGEIVGHIHTGHIRDRNRNPGWCYHTDFCEYGENLKWHEVSIAK